MTHPNKNVPELRFPEFEGEWEENRLETLVNFSKGKLLGKKDLSEDGSYPCILYGELYTKYGAIINTIQSRTNVNPNKLKKAGNNQVLIPSSGETVEDIATASAINVNDDVYIGGDLNILTPKKDDGRFISLSLNSVNKWNVSRFAQGKTVVHLYNSDLKNLKINIPVQFEEQQKTGDFFSKLDHQIELEEQKLALLEEQKEGYMQKIFSQELRFKDDNGENYPEWENKYLHEISDLNPKSNYLPDKFYYIDLESVNNGQINQLKVVNKINAPSRAQRLAKKHDVFYQTVRPYQKNNFINLSNRNDIVVSTGYAQLRPLVHYYYLYTLLLTNSFVNKVLVKCTGTNYPAINSKDLSLISILSSSVLEEQQKIGDFFNKLDQQIELQGQKIECLKQRKKGLLQKMFV
ncbi:restriction endonuclease subunit S [Staphylococcus ursi]|uniref:restriction endonuclease subunit S n=1 Tax=Staphylococcus sp. MI 10-1553 TaxID=1912064 RepID=UPI0013981D24|nr:restriction endonuclease subunit S [Staphylococcus sp. MI 10-1553]QHW37408.1 restriction endonuclease subunit S [Staphylococcus sp. MI 10-1553]